MGLLVLLLGMGFYYLFRDSHSSLLAGWLHDTLMHNSAASLSATKFLGWSPSMLHVLGFSLLMHAVVTEKRGNVICVISLWVTINWLFEVMQLHAVYKFFNSIGLVLDINVTRHWPFFGTFSVEDLFGALLGGVIAYLFIKVINHEYGSASV